MPFPSVYNIAKFAFAAGALLQPASALPSSSVRPSATKSHSAHSSSRATHSLKPTSTAAPLNGTSNIPQESACAEIANTQIAFAVTAGILLGIAEVDVDPCMFSVNFSLLVRTFTDRPNKRTVRFSSLLRRKSRFLQTLYTTVWSLCLWTKRQQLNSSNLSSRIWSFNPPLVGSKPPLRLINSQPLISWGLSTRSPVTLPAEQSKANTTSKLQSTTLSGVHTMDILIYTSHYSRYLDSRHPTHSYPSQKMALNFQKSMYPVGRLRSTIKYS